jgi:hypothetical protein
MTRKIASRLLVAALLSLATPLLACPSKPKSTVEKMTDSAEDALNVREHEKLKDAGEDVQDAVKDAGDAAKEETD